MISSRFNIIVEDYPAKGRNVLYNARTQALLSVDNPFRDALLRLDGSIEMGDAGDHRLEEGAARLRESGIIAQSRQEEDRKLDGFFAQLRAGAERLPFEATILTTYACNFRCTYCFEESARQNAADMDERTAAQVVAWLIRKMSARTFRKVVCVFYGGEPLLNVPAIRLISSRFGAWARGHGTEFKFAVITNGSLVTRELVDELLPLGLDHLRVTLDGDRGCHDAKRPFADGSPSFEVIMAAIKSVIDRVAVSVAGNFDHANYAGIPRLLDYLEAEGLLRRFRQVRFLPISPRLGPVSNPGAVEMGECVSFFGKEGMFREIVELKRLLAARGVDARSGLAVNACSVIIRDSAAAIDPAGDIYLCNALIGYPQFSAGSIFGGDTASTGAVFGDVEAWKKCAPDCPYVPLCQGGCRFFSYIEHKDFSSLVCKREYFDRIMPDLIRLEYDNMTGKR